MTPEEFIARWASNTQNERSAGQSFFNDLCDLVGVPRPTDEPSNQLRYGFEGLVEKSSGGRGFADVYWLGHFAGEFKRPGECLNAALSQLEGYAASLWNPPVLFVTDRLRIQIHLRFSGRQPRTFEIPLPDLRSHANLALVQSALSAPWSLESHTVPYQPKPLTFTPPAPVATFDVLADAKRVRDFIAKIDVAYRDLMIGDNRWRRTSLPTGGMTLVSGLNSYSAMKMIPADLRSIHSVLKSIQDEIVVDLSNMTTFFRRFTQDNGRYWFAGDDAEHERFLSTFSQLRSNVTRLQNSVKSLVG
ncbi:type IIL restriction-modification enzyme MmeI [Cupriavidus basilensis]|uniref:type IIL restriction-modification enzyme MmeI n=1 Tax=Cupriavidus basilensis TaxID=68895 RepID=UPI00157B37B7|nr:type IIL restriction-modification enzyme MmeI [Cupriavidus basilensis]NUA32158.1 hypothetical protein [Cupriavidus basilensis]